jgi:hypothetical protein
MQLHPSPAIFAGWSKPTANVILKRMKQTLTSKKLLCAVFAVTLTCTTLAVAQETGYWRAASKTAKSITGDVGITSEKISINFSSFWIAQIRSLTPAELGATFAADASAPGSGNLYRLSIPSTKHFLHKTAICGDEDTQWMATYVSGRRLQIAFFSTSQMPVLTTDALTNNSNLCGVFAYER